MSLAIFFWFAYFLSLFFSLYSTSRVPNRAGWLGWSGSALLYFVLIGILGYAKFGAAIHH